MMLRKKLLAFTAVIAFVAAFGFSKDIRGSDIPDDLFSNYNVLSVNASAVGNAMSAPVGGKIKGAYKSSKGKTVVIECSVEYYWKNEIATCTYDFILTDVADYKDLKIVEAGQEIGTFTAKTCLIARSKELNPYLVRLTGSQIIKHKDYYYYKPDWIMYGNTTFLDYRQVASLEEHAKDFYNRWYSELEEEDGGFKYVSLFNWSERDSIRVKIVLDEYPKPMEGTVATGMVQMAYFGRNIFATQTPYECNSEYTPFLYWQDGFDGYLMDEYELGTELYIYCTFLGLDHENKRLIVNVRDFALHADEEVYETRLTDIMEL